MKKKTGVLIHGAEYYPTFDGSRVHFSWVKNHERHMAQVFVKDDEDPWAVISKALKSKPLNLVGQVREL